MSSTLLLLGLIISLVAVLVSRFMEITDISKVEEFHGFENCQLLNLDYASEDLQFIEGTNIALLGLDDRVELWHKKGPEHTPQGGIAALKIGKDGKAEVKNLEMKGFPKDLAFHPHGLHILGKKLYVTNHAYSKGKERIEVFHIQNKESKIAVQFERSIIIDDSMLGITNDFAMISDKEFFMTLWRPFADDVTGRKKDPTKELWNLFKMTWGYQTSSLVRCKDVKGTAQCSEVGHGVMMNGITYHKNELFVADSLAKKIHHYTFTESSLTYQKAFTLPHVVDNIEYNEETQMIYISQLSKVIDYFGYLDILHAGGTPTHVINGGCVELNPKTGQINEYVIQSKLSGCSACTKYKNYLVMGSWHDPHALVCPMGKPKVY